MTDTPASVSARYTRGLLSQSPARRIEMACSMFVSAKALVLAGIRLRNGDSDPEEERRALFVRLYGDDFTREDVASVVAYLRAA